MRASHRSSDGCSDHARANYRLGRKRHMANIVYRLRRKMEEWHLICRMAKKTNKKNIT